MKSPPPSTSCRGKQKGLGLKSKRASIWFVFLAHVSSEHCVTGLLFYTAGKDHLEIRQIWGARVVVLWVKLLPAMSASHMSANLNLATLLLILLRYVWEREEGAGPLNLFITWPQDSRSMSVTVSFI